MFINNFIKQSDGKYLLKETENNKSVSLLVSENPDKNSDCECHCLLTYIDENQKESKQEFCFQVEQYFRAKEVNINLFKTFISKHIELQTK